MIIAETTCQLPLEQLQPGQYQPRRDFDAEALQELAQSITHQGLIEPIIVRPLTKNKGYEIIAGERRWRAHQLLQKSHITCIVRYYDDEEAQLVSLVENISRQDLNPIEEAHAYQRLRDEFAYTHDDIAQKTGKSRSKISNLLRLLQLPERIQQILIQQELSEGHGKIIASLPPTEQWPWTQRCLDQGLSVRQLEKALKQSQKPENSSAKDNDVKRLERHISEHLGAPVTIDDREGQGGLTIHYANLDILEGILKKIDCDTE